MKKEKSLEKKIEEILRHYWWEHYGKEAYIKNCTKKLLELYTENSSKEKL